MELVERLAREARERQARAADETNEKLGRLPPRGSERIDVLGNPVTTERHVTEVDGHEVIRYTTVPAPREATEAAAALSGAGARTPPAPGQGVCA